MSNNVNITSKGIKKVLKNYNSSNSIAEYIWNGFDAKADTVDLNYDYNELGTIKFIKIQDNGTGINFNHLKQKFNPFYDSEKAIELSAPKHTSTMHGKNGVGRLTFFNFASIAEWRTTYRQKDKLSSFNIKINANNIDKYEIISLEQTISTDTGTNVIFSGVLISKEELENVIIPFLVNEFCWFLELNKAKGFKIYINGVLLDYTSNIHENSEEIEVHYDKSNTLFKFRFIQWKEALHKEFSKYYFLNEESREVYKDYTTLNKKGDTFFHSIFIQSKFFDDFDFRSSENDTQENIFGKAKSSPEYKFLIKKINEYLRNKRKPFLRIYASRLVEMYEEGGILPEYKNEWEEKYKKPQLIETLIALYEVNPKLFRNLNVEQKKTFVRFLDLLLDSNEREKIFLILEDIVDLDSDERQDLTELLKTTKLNRIIQTIKLIEDRYKTYYKLKDLVFDKKLKANEVNHLQKLIEKHYWLFGEQYHLVTAAEPKFEEALRRYLYLLTAKDTSEHIDHPDKLREMDIFACRQNTTVDRIENIVIELKHPLINIGSDQYNQVHKYLSVIINQPEFNAPNMSWEFHLIGNKFDNSKYIENLISTNKPHGLKSLALNLEDGRIKVFIKTWSEVFAEFEMRHRHLDEKLKFERDMLFNTITSASGIVNSVQENHAISSPEVKIPMT